MNDIQLAWCMFADPRTGFAELRDRPRFWFPLLLVIASVLGTIIWNLNVTDIDALREHLIDANPTVNRMTAAERAQYTQFMTRNTFIGTQVATALLVLVAARLLESGYFSLAGKAVQLPLSFKRSLSLASWSALPHVLTFVVFALLLGLQHGEPSAQTLSLNDLFFHLPRDSPWATFWGGITLPHFWVWALTVIGVRVWSGRSFAFSAVFGLLPVLVAQGARVLTAVF